MTTQYSSIQKISLAGIVIGALMCWVGACAPYWIVSDPKGFEGLGSLLSKIVKGSLGLFMYCVEVPGKSGCEFIDIDSDSGWFHSARVGAIGCMLIGGLAGMISLCLACCNCCKRFIVVGILAFLGAASGAFCLIVFSKNTEVFTASVLDFKVSSYGWAFYAFGCGVGMLGIVSFMACFSAPENPLRGMILSQPAGQVIVSTSTGMSTVHNPYMHLREQGGPIMTGPPNPEAPVTSEEYRY